jgi:nucleotide-binding universal stress UspA family protein
VVSRNGGPPGGGEQAGRVVVGVDRTASGLRALRRAIDEAAMRGAELHAVRAWAMARELGEEAVRTVIGGFADSVGQVPREVTVRPVVVADAPGPALVGYADREADLLVVGSGRGPRWHRPFGSRVVRHCLANAGCPLLVIPPPSLTRGRSPRDLLRELRHDLDRRGVW